MLIILFLIGLISTFYVAGTIIKYISGRWFDEEFVGDFVKSAMSISLKITVVIISYYFVSTIVAFAKYQLF